MWKMRGYVHGHAATITQEFGLSEVDFLFNVYVSPVGFIDSISFTVTNAPTTTVAYPTLAEQVLLPTAVGTKIESPGGSKDCIWQFPASARQ
jgi:hypothetical protein